MMLRGNDGRPIFTGDGDRRALADLLAEGVERFGHRVLAYCFMTNHVHLEIQVGETPLSRIVQNAAFRYTRQFNRRVGRTGHLFQGRYRSLLVEADSYLLELVRYIHLNPVRSRLVEAPEDWRWSGHRAYLGGEETPWMDCGFVLRMFDGQDPGSARRRYRSFVHQKLGETYREELHRGDGDPRVLGSDGFLVDVLCLDGSLSMPWRTPSLEEIEECVGAAWGLGTAELVASGKRRDASEARAVVGLLATELKVATLTRVAERMGRDGATLSHRVRRLQMELGKRPDLLERIAELRGRLSAQIAEMQA